MKNILVVFYQMYKYLMKLICRFFHSFYIEKKTNELYIRTKIYVYRINMIQIILVIPCFFPPLQMIRAKMFELFQSFILGPENIHFHQGDWQIDLIGENYWKKNRFQKCSGSTHLIKNLYPGFCFVTFFLLRYSMNKIVYIQ